MSARGFDPEQPVERPVRRRAPLSTGYVWGRDELARLDDPEVVEQLAASGCDELVIDFDTLGGPADSRPLVLGALVRQLQRRGFAIHGIFTLGQDHDDLGCFERLVEWVEAQRLVTVELRLWTPDPGSSLVRMLAREDRIRHRALDRWDGAHVVVAPKQMSAQALYRGWVWAQRRLDSLASIWRRRPRDRVGLLRYATTMIAAKLGSRERLLPAFTPARETSRPPSRPPRPLLLAPLASLARGLVDFDRRS